MTTPRSARLAATARSWRLRWSLSCIRVALLFSVVGTSPWGHAQELVLGDFGTDRDAFNYTFGGFTQTVRDTGVVLVDPDDNSGGAGIALGGLDLSGLGDTRLAVDFTPIPGSRAPRFDIELIDSSSPDGQTLRSGKWSFDVAGLTPGEPTRLVSQTTLSSPTSGIGDFASLDLSAVSTWQVLGDFSTQAPFGFEFHRVTLLDAPAPPPYEGAELDASWRAEADARIDAVRKGDLRVTVVDSSGHPVPGAVVDVAMQQHEFGFGSAVQARRLRDSAPQHAEYKSRVSELFNVATLENNLKWQAWEGEWGSSFTQTGALSALDWLAGQGIDARGHVLVWPGSSNLPADIRQMLDDGSLSTAEQQLVRDRITNHIAEIAGATDGRVVAWDVINETRTNNDLMRELSESDLAMVDWLNQAAAADPDSARYINDFGILNSWGAGGNRDQYFNTVQYLLEQGAPLDGIGFQGHFSTDDLTGPEELWEVVDRFAELGLDMQVTEFDINTTDEDLQAAYTRDFLTAMFAHEAIDDVILWGFWEDAHWRPDAAMYRSDWSLKPNGQAYLDLVFGEWWTDESGVVDQDGEFAVRGFKGEYQVAAAFAGHQTSADAVLGDSGALVLTLPLLLGDYNNDGVVDAGDYTVWRDTFGSTSELSADGNADGVVNDEDYQLWLSRFGATASQAMPTTGVPEPGAAALLVAAFAAATSRRRRQRPTATTIHDSNTLTICSHDRFP